VHGLWASTLYESLLVLFALAASVPHSAAVNTGAGDTVPANWRGTLRLDDAEKRR
jgi:hypothetical protein